MITAAEAVRNEEGLDDRAGATIAVAGSAEADRQPPDSEGGNGGGGGGRGGGLNAVAGTRAMGVGGSHRTQHCHRHRRCAQRPRQARTSPRSPRRGCRPAHATRHARAGTPARHSASPPTCTVRRGRPTQAPAPPSPSASTRAVPAEWGELLRGDGRVCVALSLTQWFKDTATRQHATLCLTTKADAANGAAHCFPPAGRSRYLLRIAATGQGVAVATCPRRGAPRRWR